MDHEDVIKIFYYLYSNRNDNEIIDIINRTFENLGYDMYSIISYELISDRYFIFNISKPPHHFTIYKYGGFSNMTTITGTDMLILLKHMITYIKYKKRKDIIDSI